MWEIVPTGSSDTMTLQNVGRFYNSTQYRWCASDGDTRGKMQYWTKTWGSNSGKAGQLYGNHRLVALSPNASTFYKMYESDITTIRRLQ